MTQHSWISTHCEMIIIMLSPMYCLTVHEQEFGSTSAHCFKTLILSLATVLDLMMSILPRLLRASSLLAFAATMQTMGKIYSLVNFTRVLSIVVVEQKSL